MATNPIFEIDGKPQAAQTRRNLVKKKQVYPCGHRRSLSVTDAGEV